MKPNPSRPVPQARAVGIREVARQAGVSIATVSRVYNDELTVQPETRLRVLDCAAQLGYQPSPLGRNLVTGRSRLMGLIVPSLNYPLYGEMLTGAEDALAEHGLRVLLATSHDDLNSELAAAARLLEHAIDGGIVINSMVGARLPTQRSAPWAHVAPEMAGLPGAVELDNVEGGRLAARALLAGGARHPAYLAGYGRESTERERGFREVMEEAGVPYRRAPGDYSVGAGEAGAAELLESGPLDALFAAGDLMAAGALRALHAAGRRVPDDVGVIGFDDTVFAELLYPALSSVRQPAHAMGAAAARTALALVAGEQPGPTVFLPELIPRASTRLPP